MPPRLRVGMIGAGVEPGWGPEAHLPALRGLDEFELVAVATSRQETADAAAASSEYRWPSATLTTWFGIPTSMSPS